MANTIKGDDGSEFPGYPHYPAKEDIMNAQEAERVDMDVENLSRSKDAAPGLTDIPAKSPPSVEEDIALTGIDDGVEALAETNAADLTPDDLMALGEEDANFETVNKTMESDLDVPGSEDDDADEDIGEEDEENNYYSLGGDAHENLEEDKAG